MAHILDSILENRTVQTIERDAQDVEHVVDKVLPVLKSVTFKLPDGTPHTLTFLPAGTVTSVTDDVKRVVGDAQTAYHEFYDAETAVQAFLDGKV